MEQLARGAYDPVLVAMRKNKVQPVLPVLAANYHTPSILFLGNNAAGPDELVTALRRERVLMGFGGVGAGRACRALRRWEEAPPGGGPRRRTGWA